MNKKFEKEINLLDCTLRDGSYVIDYQFTAEDTAILTAGLESAGFRYIEIGHGLGLGASRKGHGIAAASDEEYLMAVRDVIKKAKFGMFCIPGIAELKDIKNAAKYGIGFIRIGTNVTDAEKAEPFIKKAKDLGIFTSLNLMKSYALDPTEFAQKIKLAGKYGSDVICVVDSAGGMLPQGVYEYIKIVRNETDAMAGFHGHDNLRLAISNSLEAIRAGATFIDASLRGMGRSAGNAQTELMVILLEKMGYKTGINLFKTLDLGEKVVKPMMRMDLGVDAMSAIVGTAQFHTSFMNTVLKVAKKYAVDPRKLIIEVSKIDRVTVSEDLAETVAQKLKPIGKPPRIFHQDLNLKSFVKNYRPSNLKKISRDIALEMLSLSKKTGKKTVFTLAPTPNKNKRYTTFPFIRQNEAYIIGNAEVISPNDGLQIIQSINGLVDFILLDQPLYHQLDGKFNGLSSQVLIYDDLEAKIISLYKKLTSLSSKRQLNVFITGNNLSAHRLNLYLLSHNHISWMESAIENVSEISLKNADFLIGLTPFEESITPKMLNHISDQTIVIDAGPRSISQKAVLLGQKRGIRLYRIDMRAGLFGEVETVLQTYFLLNHVAGEKRIRGINTVSGGVIGKRGNVVVDCITQPTRVIGIADGQGGLLIPKESKKFMKDFYLIKNVIAERYFQ